MNPNASMMFVFATVNMVAWLVIMVFHHIVTFGWIDRRGKNG